MQNLKLDHWTMPLTSQVVVIRKLLKLRQISKKKQSLKLDQKTMLVTIQVVVMLRYEFSFQSSGIFFEYFCYDGSYIFGMFVSMNDFQSCTFN